MLESVQRWKVHKFTTEKRRRKQSSDFVNGKRLSQGHRMEGKIQEILPGVIFSWSLLLSLSDKYSFLGKDCCHLHADISLSLPRKRQWCSHIPRQNSFFPQSGMLTLRRWLLTEKWSPWRFLGCPVRVVHCTLQIPPHKQNPVSPSSRAMVRERKEEEEGGREGGRKKSSPGEGGGGGFSAIFCLWRSKPLPS